MQIKHKWTDATIERGIRDAQRILCIDRMPSNSELYQAYNNQQLSNAIAKSGGFRFWANKLGLAIKQTDTEHGYRQELKVIGIIRQRGYTAEDTPVKFPYDVLVNGMVKIDVKCARISKVREHDTYAFHISKDMPTCDLYFICCLDDADAIKMLYIIPAHKIRGQVQLVMSGSQVSKKYAKYLNRWDLLDKCISNFNELI